MADVQPTVRRLTQQALLLAAVAARVRLDELGVQGDPAVREQIDRAVRHLDIGDLDAMTPAARGTLLSGVRTSLRQALELLEAPDRDAAWTHADPVLLQSQGRASAAVAGLFLAAGVGHPGARILDVGTGVAALAIAFCAAYPDATVVGIDPWAPALELARGNIAEAGLSSRITLLEGTADALEDAEGFDLVWFPSRFIPEPVIDASLMHVHSLMRPRGEVVLAVLEYQDDEQASIVEDLKTARAGGSLLTVADATRRVEAAGFGEIRVAAATPPSPMRLIIGRA